MAINFDKVAERIFEIVKSRGHVLKLYKENGEVALDPAKDARRFWLEKDDIMVSLIQQGEDSEIKMYVGKNKELNDIESLLQNLRTLAGRFGLLFNVRKFGTELKPKHFAFLAHQAQEEENEMNEHIEIFEAEINEARDVTRLKGSHKSSYQNIGKPTKLIVRHTGVVDETKFASRARNIGKIFVETNEGERLKFPVPYLQGARAMARHMSEGGEWNDDIGSYIKNECTEYGAMKTFRKHNKGINEETTRITGIVKERISQIALEMKKIQGPRSYRHFKENFEAKPNKLEEDLLEYEINRIRGIFETDLDNSVLETIAKLTTTDDTESAMTAEAVIAKVHNLIESGDISFAPRFTKSPTFENKRARAAHIATDLSERVNNGDIAGFLSELASRITSKGKTTIRENEALIKLHELSRSAVSSAGIGEPLAEFNEWAESFELGTDTGKFYVKFHGVIEGPFVSKHAAYMKFGSNATWIKPYAKMTPSERREVGNLGEDADEDLAKDMASNPGLRDQIRKNPKKELRRYTRGRE